MNKVVIKNMISLLGIHCVNYLVPVITLPYLVRTLGAKSYGELGFTIAFIQYFAIMTEFGFNLSITKKIALYREDKTEVSSLFWNIMSCKLLLAGAGFIIMLLLMTVVPMLQSLRWVLFCYYLNVIGFLLFPIWLFQGLEKMGWIAACNITAKVSAVPLTFWLVQSPADANMAALTISLTNLFAGCIALGFVYRHGWVNWQRPSFQRIWSELKDGWYVFISMASMSLYASSTTVILCFIAGPVAVGYFVAADKFRQLVQGVIGPVSQAIYPRMNTLFASNRDEGFSALRKLIIAQAVGCLCLSIGLYLVSDWLVALAYGAGHAHTVTVLHWLAWMPFMVGLTNVFGVQTLLVLGFKKEFGRAHLTAGVFSVVVLMPMAYWLQEQGAAIITLASECVVFLMMLFAVWRKKVPIFRKVA